MNRGALKKVTMAASIPWVIIDNSCGSIIILSENIGFYLKNII